MPEFWLAGGVLGYAQQVTKCCNCSGFIEVMDASNQLMYTIEGQALSERLSEMLQNAGCRHYHCQFLCKCAACWTGLNTQGQNLFDVVSPMSNCIGAICCCIVGQMPFAVTVPHVT